MEGIETTVWNTQINYKTLLALMYLGNFLNVPCHHLMEIIHYT